MKIGNIYTQTAFYIEKIRHPIGCYKQWSSILLSSAVEQARSYGVALDGK